MNKKKLIIKSLLFYWRTNLGVLFGAAISTAIIVGALVVGDSVRYSLRQITFERFGRIEFALQSGDRFFRAELAEEMADELSVDATSTLNLTGIAISAGGNRRANRLRGVGIEIDFGKLSEGTVESPDLTTDEVY